MYHVLLAFSIANKDVIHRSLQKAVQRYTAEGATIGTSGNTT